MLNFKGATWEKVGITEMKMLRWTFGYSVIQERIEYIKDLEKRESTVISYWGNSTQLKTDYNSVYIAVTQL